MTAEDKEAALCVLNAIGAIKQTGLSHGKIPCPKCGADLLYSVAKSNKHIHGKCSTPNCLNWMQ